MYATIRVRFCTDEGYGRLRYPNLGKRYREVGHTDYENDFPNTLKKEKNCRNMSSLTGSCSGSFQQSVSACSSSLYAHKFSRFQTFCSLITPRRPFPPRLSYALTNHPQFPTFLRLKFLPAHSPAQTHPPVFLPLPPH